MKSHSWLWATGKRISSLQEAGAADFSEVDNRYYFIFQILHTGSAWQTWKHESSIISTTLTFTVNFPHKGVLKYRSVTGFFQVEAIILPGVEGSVFPLWNIWHFTELPHSFSIAYDIFYVTSTVLKDPPLFWSDRVKWTTFYNTWQNSQARINYLFPLYSK